LPKLDGNRVALRGRVLPDTHARAAQAAAVRGLSLSDYLAMLIEQDTTTAQSHHLHESRLPIADVA
jgi:hypothetical protein